MLAGHQAGCAPPRNEHGTNHQIGLSEVSVDGVRIGVNGRHVRGHLRVEDAQSIEIDVHEDDVRAEARGDARGVFSDDAAAEHDDVRRLDAGYAAEQDPAASHRLLEVLRALLNRHAPGHFAHRREERQPVSGIAERLVRDRRVPGGEGTRRELVRRREMEIAEHDVLGTEHVELRAERLFDFDDELRAREELLRGVDQDGAGALVLFVGEPAAATRAALDEHLMPVARQEVRAHRTERHAVFVVLDLVRDAYDHPGILPRLRDRGRRQRR